MLVGDFLFCMPSESAVLAGVRSEVRVVCLWVISSFVCQVRVQCWLQAAN